MDASIVPDTVGAARERRAGLRAVLVDLEACIAAPVPGRADDWRSSVTECMRHLSEAFADHVEGTEGPDGLFAQVRRRSPRLDNATKRLAADHVAINEQMSVVAAADEPAAVREAVLKLLAMLARHRQAGADLVYEAYAVDIGGSD